MMSVVSLVSTLVQLYSVFLMASDAALPRFLSLLAMFTGFMTLLVVATARCMLNARMMYDDRDRKL